MEISLPVWACCRCPTRRTVTRQCTALFPLARAWWGLEQWCHCMFQTGGLRAHINCSLTRSIPARYIQLNLRRNDGSHSCSPPSNYNLADFFRVISRVFVGDFCFLNTSTKILKSVFIFTWAFWFNSACGGIRARGKAVRVQAQYASWRVV